MIVIQASGASQNFSAQKHVTFPQKRNISATLRPICQRWHFRNFKAYIATFPHTTTLVLHNFKNHEQRRIMNNITHHVRSHFSHAARHVMPDCGYAGQGFYYSASSFSASASFGKSLSIKNAPPSCHISVSGTSVKCLAMPFMTSAYSG